MKYSLSVVLLISVLLLSTGMPLFSHICRLSGAVSLSVLPKEDCSMPLTDDGCPAEQSLAKDGCCMKVNTVLKADFSIRKVTAEIASAPQPALLSFFGFSYTRCPAATEVILTAADASPPLAFSGRDILTQIRILRI